MDTHEGDKDNREETQSVEVQRVEIQETQDKLSWITWKNYRGLP